MGIISLAHLLLNGMQLNIQNESQMIFSTKTKFGMKIAAAAAASLFAMSSAHAYKLDTLLNSADLGNSGAGTELQAISKWVNVTLEQITKVASDNVVFADSEGTDQYFINVAPLKPANFLLKFGTGNTGEDNTYFFTNIGEMDKLVFDNEQVNGLANKFSHYTLYSIVGGDGGGNGNNVPEPATAALLGLGLLGFAAARRKQKKA